MKPQSYLHLTFSQTQLVEVVTWQVGYNTQRDKGLGFSLQFTQCQQEAAASLPALKPWHCLSIRLSHLQTSQWTERVIQSKLVIWPIQPIMFSWWQNSSRSVRQNKHCLFLTYHNHNLLFHNCNLCIYFFGYVISRKNAL